MTAPTKSDDLYRQAGVDIDEADRGLSGLAGHVQRTWRRDGPGRVLLELGYYANVVEVGGMGIALCTDGVGSKALIADMLRKYDTIGIDCVAMNVNDVICVGAEPISMVDYIAVEAADGWMLAEIGKGLARGAELAGGISISGGEIAQLKDIINGFDLVGMAVGRVALDQVSYGQHVQPGDVVIGIESSGIHSNGMTLARRALFQRGGFTVDHRFADLDGTLGEELLKPTHIYVPEVVEILRTLPAVKALLNITGDGFLNLARVAAPVGFVLDDLPPPPPIFTLIQRYGEVATAEMHEVYNMGVGFCVVVAPEQVARALAIIAGHGRRAWPIGHTVADPEKQVKVTAHRLVGQGKHFVQE